jgi:hypothetical protein
VLEREGYAVAAGSALGFVALGELHFMKHVPVASLTRHIKTEIT